MANEYIRKEWAGGVVRTTLNGAINGTATSISLVDGSSFPSGVKPFVLVIDRGLSTEEKIIVTSRTGNTLTVLQRGYDGSTQQSHATGAYVEHTLDAYTVDQANALATTMTTQGDVIYKTVTGDNTSFGRLGIGTTGYPLVSAGTAPAYQQLGSTGIASTAVTAAKINADVAGLGLVKNGTSNALDVNVDATTLEINADIVRVKDSGITAAKVQAGTLTEDKLAASARPIIICTSLTRPASPVAGQMIFQTDNLAYYVYVSAAWMCMSAKGTYTPNLANLSVGTGGSASNTANWSYNYGILTVQGELVFGTSGVTYPGATSSVGTTALPIGFTAGSAVGFQTWVGGAIMNVSSSGFTAPIYVVAGGANPTVRFVVGKYDPTSTTNPSYVGNANPSTTIPGTWSAGDYIRYSFTINGTLG